jgi:RNA polymerase sigma factor (sigma-70 family)
MGDDLSADLLARWRTGDQQAAGDLVCRYAGRLIALARSRLSAQLAQRVDPEDVVQSAYRSFFADAGAGRYDFQGGGNLWQLLVLITLHKIQDQVDHFAAQKRCSHREQSLTGADGLAVEAHMRTHEPSPVEAVALVEEVESLMQRLEPQQRPMLEMRLQGWTLEEIAAATGRTERTVRRVLDRVKEWLTERGAGEEGAS